MIFLRKILDFYINASIHVALAVYCLFQITCFYFDLHPNSHLGLAIFFGTISGYNYIKYNNLYKKTTSKLRLIFGISIISTLICFYHLTFLNQKNLFLIAILGLISFAYAIPLNIKSLRYLPKLKIFIIALVWAGVTVSLTFEEFKPIYFLYFIQRFMFIIALTIPFDIRDLHHDTDVLKTLPQHYGIKKTKKIGFILLVFSLILEFILSPNTYFKNIFLLIFIILTVFIQRASPNQSKYYSSFWVEGIPILWFLILKYLT